MFSSNAKVCFVVAPHGIIYDVVHKYISMSAVSAALHSCTCEISGDSRANGWSYMS